MSSFTESKELEKPEADVVDELKEIHIAVFFDGTSNNMVQQARANGYLLQTLENGGNEIFSNSGKETNARLNVTDDMLYQDQKKGYSNVAILYSQFKDEEELEKKYPNTKWYHFYVEGSGAWDITHLVGKNPNGLGFGLGNTGVTALVSKAVRYSNNYINSLSTHITEQTELHFYIFGFSRGSTCARLFSHLITRNNTTLEKREKEFKSFLPKDYFVNGRLAFLEKQQQVYKTKLNRKKISVDFLGIYDTVASIGFLRQKDGWYDSKQLGYSWAQNYKDNWHYRNVEEYGLYISKDKTKQKNVCHICALDEFRENFALTNIGKKVPENAIEILVPGCHSDIGGGYLTGYDQEVSLAKQTEKGGEEKKTSLPLKSYKTKPSIMYMTDPKANIPLSDFESYKICTDSLAKLGWIDENWHKTPKNIRYTYSLAEHKDVIYFKKKVERGLSDITLAMMKKCCMECKIELFSEQADIAYDYKKTIADKTIIDFGKKLVGAVTKPNGKRIWIIPGGSNDSVLYRKLRRKYIHFTSSSSLAHIINPLRNWELNAPMGGSPANFGNKPNYDLDGLLCRITYHGDNVHYDSHSQGVNYVYDIKNGEVIV